LGVGLTTLPCKKRKLLRSLQEIQPDFLEEAKASAGLWSQGKKKEDVGTAPADPLFGVLDVVQAV
jgi:hypothetical protein